MMRLIMMNKIRPYEVLELIRSTDREVKFILPDRQTKLKSLEVACLLALLKYLKPCRVFEFGMHRGETAWMLAENSDAKVTTLDIVTDPRLYKSNAYTTMICDSLNYKHKDLGTHEYVFIDAGHSLNCVVTDTLNAFRMIHNLPVAVIIWYGYEDQRFRITEYLDELNKDKKIYHIEETALVFYPQGWDLRQ